MGLSEEMIFNQHDVSQVPVKPTAIFHNPKCFIE